MHYNGYDSRASGTACWRTLWSDLRDGSWPTSERRELFREGCRRDLTIGTFERLATLPPEPDREIKPEPRRIGRFVGAEPQRGAAAVLSVNG